MKTFSFVLPPRPLSMYTAFPPAVVRDEEEKEAGGGGGAIVSLHGAKG